MNRAEELRDIAEQNADRAQLERGEYHRAGVGVSDDCRGGHHMVPDGWGRGVCTGCNLAVDRDEL